MHRRPRAVRSIPEAIEHAFRTAARECSFMQIDKEKFAREMTARALFHFERIIRASSILGSADTGRAELVSAIGRFAKSHLRRRLTTLSMDRTHLADHREIDLIALGRDGKPYAIRFIAFRSISEEPALARRLRATSSDVAGLIVYSIGEALIRRYSLEPSPPVRSGNGGSPSPITMHRKRKHTVAGHLPSPDGNMIAT